MSVTRSTRRRSNQIRQARRAFTLLEIIVVVTIIALLATLVAPRLLARVGQSKQNIAKADVASLAQQVSLYLLDNGMSTPPDDLTLEALTEGDDPPLKAKDIVDPWGNHFFIRTGMDAVNPDFDIVSYGADGQAGGEGENADIVN